jgi:hypothetical protein
MAVATISGNKRIVLKAGYTEGGVEQTEGPAGGAISPGMNVVRSGISRVLERDTWVVGATNAVGTGTSDLPAAAPVRVAKEAADFGLTTSDVYATGDNVFVHIAKAGDNLQVLVASGQNFVKGQGLSAGSDGKWVVDNVTAAVEALEQTGGALGADTLVRVAVL